MCEAVLRPNPGLKARAGFPARARPVVDFVAVHVHEQSAILGEFTAKFSEETEYSRVNSRCGWRRLHPRLFRRAAHEVAPVGKDSMPSAKPTAGSWSPEFLAQIDERAKGRQVRSRQRASTY